MSKFLFDQCTHSQQSQAAALLIEKNLNIYLYFIAVEIALTLLPQRRTHTTKDERVFYKYSTSLLLFSFSASIKNIKEPSDASVIVGGNQAWRIMHVFPATLMTTFFSLFLSLCCSTRCQVVDIRACILIFYYSNSLRTKQELSHLEVNVKVFQWIFSSMPRNSLVSLIFCSCELVCVYMVFFSLPLLRLVSVAICWILIFLRLIFIRVYGQVALVSVAIFVILETRAMILSKVLISGYQLMPSSPASSSKLSSGFECKLFFPFFLSLLNWAQNWANEEKRNKKIKTPKSFCVGCRGSFTARAASTERRKWEKNANVKWKIVFTIQWRWCWFPVNSRTRFLLARSPIPRTERHSLFRHFECIYRVGRCRVTSPTPPLFGLSLKVLIKKNPNIRGWVVHISVYGYIRSEVSWPDFMYTFFKFFLPYHLPWPVCLSSCSIYDFVCVARLALVPFSGHHIEYDIQ